MIGRHFGLLAWPVIGAAVVLGFLAWRLYDADGAEQSLLRAIAAAILIAIAIFGLILPSLGQLFPSVALARVLRDSGCSQPVAAAAGYQEPSLVFLAGTSTRLTDARRRRRVPARRGLPLRLRRSTPGEELRPTRRSDRPALHARAAHRGRSISAPDRRSRLRSTAREPRHERRRRAQACADAARTAVAPMDRRQCSAMAGPDRPPGARPSSRVRAVACSAPPRRRRRHCDSAHCGDDDCARRLGDQGGAAPADVADDRLRRIDRLRQIRLVPDSDRRRAARDCRARVARASPHVASGACSHLGADRLRVSGDRRARPCRHHREAPDRSRASAGRCRRRPIPLSAVRLGRRICEPAVRTCHHRVRSGARDRRDVAAAAAARCGPMR